MKRIIGVFVMVLFCVPQTIHAQNFEELFNDFVRQSQQQFNDFVQESQQIFGNFSDSISHVFADAMVDNMRTFTSETPMVRDPKPKPNVQPGTQKDETPELPKINPTIPEEKPEQSTPNYTQPQDNTDDNRIGNQYNFYIFNIFGDHVRLSKKPFPDKLNGISPEDIRDFWIQIEQDNCQEMLQSCMVAREQQGFNDWAIFQLVLRMVQQIYDHQYNEQVVMAIYLLNQLGLDARVGLGATHLFCILGIDQNLYDVVYFQMENNKYYCFEINPNYLRANEEMLFTTYEIPTPIISLRGLDMNIRQPLKSAATRYSEQGGIIFNMSMIDLYETYPQVDIEVYANATPSKEFCQSVDKVIAPYLYDLSAYDAVAKLLKSMQEGFDYATDDEQFGYEKPFFCEENFYYPYNDCEDRSVLFSFLVRHLLHMDVVLIDYPGHVATAVHFPTEVKGEYVEYNGKKFVICDPTYEGASIGMEMDNFSPNDRTIIPLRKF